MDPRSGLLAGGQPPSSAPDQRALLNDLAQLMQKQRQQEEQQQQQDTARFQELRRDYPYGAGLPETSPSFPRPEGQWALKSMNQHATPFGKVPMPEDKGFGPPKLPPEYQPDRTIPLGELQRRWGVPRLEDL